MTACARAVGCAVLTGALVVGDSLRGSLRDRALEQLGWVAESLVAGRFFREELAANLPAKKVAPAILVQGSAVTTGKVVRRAGNVTVLAVDERFWPKEQMPVDYFFWNGEKAGVVLNHTLAAQLGVSHLTSVGAETARAMPWQRRAPWLAVPCRDRGLSSPPRDVADNNIAVDLLYMWLDPRIEIR